MARKTRSRHHPLALDVSSDDFERPVVEIDLSPIKPVVSPPELSRQVCLSPMKKPGASPKKSVTFCKQLVTPSKQAVRVPVLETPPPKLILKQQPQNQDSPTSNKFGRGGSHRQFRDPDFWGPGVIQTLHRPAELGAFLDGCLAMIQRPLFQRRFEVYASLAQVYKTHRNDEIVNHLIHVPAGSNHSKLGHFLELIRRDVNAIETRLFSKSDGNKENVAPGLPQEMELVPTTGNDPFQIRTVTLALKVMNYFMTDESLNNYLPVEDVKWFYRHAAAMLVHPQVSKALITPYVQMIKECKFLRAKRRLIFDNSDLIEVMLASLLNMKCFYSLTILIERTNCLRNFCTTFSAIMAKNAHHWLGFLILAVVTQTVSFAKTGPQGVAALSDLAALVRKNPGSLRHQLQHFLQSLIPENWLPLLRETRFGLGPPPPPGTPEGVMSPWELPTGTASEYILAYLRHHASLLETCAAQALEMWKLIVVSVEVLDTEWQQCALELVRDYGDTVVLVWRGYVYIVGTRLGDLKQMMDRIDGLDQFNSRVKQVNQELETYWSIMVAPFSWPLVSPTTLHDYLLTILYFTLHQCVAKMATKHLGVFWNQLVAPLLVRFYFNDDGTSQTAELGYKVLMHLLLALSIHLFEEERGLTPAWITFDELNNLPPRWIFNHRTDFVPVVALAMALSHLSPLHKSSLVARYITSMASILARESSVGPEPFATEAASMLEHTVALWPTEMVAHVVKAVLAPGALPQLALVATRFYATTLGQCSPTTAAAVLESVAVPGLSFKDAIAVVGSVASAVGARSQKSVPDSQEPIHDHRDPATIVWDGCLGALTAEPTTDQYDQIVKFLAKMDSPLEASLVAVIQWLGTLPKPKKIRLDTWSANLFYRSLRLVCNHPRSTIGPMFILATQNRLLEGQLPHFVAAMEQLCGDPQYADIVYRFTGVIYRRCRWVPDELQPRFVTAWRRYLGWRVDWARTQGEYERNQTDDLLCESHKNTGIVFDLTPEVLESFPKYRFMCVGSEDTSEDESDEDTNDTTADVGTVEPPTLTPIDPDDPDGELADDDDGIDVVLVDFSVIEDESLVLIDPKLVVIDSPDSSSREERATRRRTRSQTDREEAKVLVPDTPPVAPEPTRKRRKRMLTRAKQLREIYQKWSIEDTELLTPEERSEFETMSLQFTLALRK